MIYIRVSGGRVRLDEGVLSRGEFRIAEGMTGDFCDGCGEDVAECLRLVSEEGAREALCRCCGARFLVEEVG